MYEGGFLSNYLLLIPILTFIGAQIVKIGIRLGNKKFNREYLMSSGGMPSVHSAFVMALSTVIAYKEGIYSSLFALALCFSAIVLYDAMHIRYEGGKHAEVLNTLMEGKKEFAGKHFTIYLGHTPLEVLVGGIFGILFASLLYFL
jgi:acid phosphatase family membrane protein YuiD